MHGSTTSRVVALFVLLLVSATTAVRAAPLPEPQVFASAGGVLDVLMVARPAPIRTFPVFEPIGWVYDICPRPRDGSLSCPVKPGRNLYGGTRLALKPGDLLKIRLVNALPRNPDAVHIADPGHGYLVLNPTNIHTHGLEVSPRFPSVDNPTYGDSVFVMTLNPKNGQLPSDAELHGDVRIGYTDYQIAIPKSHPPGLFWLHPHVHGIAMNQIASGLAAIITIGDIKDYVCKDAACAATLRRMPIRHMLLKDAQVVTGNRLKNEQDLEFCQARGGAAPETPGRGFCKGVDLGAGRPDYTRGRWYFSLNGAPYPAIAMSNAAGEIWRITNTSANATYNLQLWSPRQKRNMLVQVLSLDGIAVDAANTEPSAAAAMTAGRVKAEPCPGAPSGITLKGLCARSILMMPSSRVELWVVDRDADDKVVMAKAGDRAVFRTAGINTGPFGDTWPAIDLGAVSFSAAGSAKLPQILDVAGPAHAEIPAHVAADLAPANAKIGTSPDCKRLPAGHMRRIFYGLDKTNPSFAGLGYDEVDADGKAVPGTFRDITAFDPSTPTVCVPLGPGNKPVTERWILMNITPLDHNFHIHQMKFGVVTDPKIENGSAATNGILVDNVPVPRADGLCVSIADWRQHKCTVHPVKVDLPFAIAGDFVYHCHIMFHEDAGMMARIRVRASP
ncbi:MAG TPA: multicopper oxidase domain-containing protein [Alphaproteobacteria bacterium]|nr:multicopper oxidase domain-containing protein [Alphaproteobacteria bacterium]